MTLAELDTPFERHRIIRYGSDGNKVVHHWYEMQHITASLYKGRERTNEYGEAVYDTFLLFAGRDSGLLYEHQMKHPEWYTPEKCLESLIRYGYDTLENFLLGLDRCVEENCHIGNAQIEFVRQFDPQRADRYAQHREKRLKAQEQRHLELLAQRKAEEQEQEERRKAEDLADRAKLLGWADEMTPMKFGRVKTVLDTLTRVDGKIMSRRDFVIRMVQDGWLPSQKDGVVSYYGSRWELKESKPKTEYRLCKGGFLYKISKTEYDFALYLTEHGTEN